MTTKTLAEGLVAAQAAARAVQKKSYNEHHRYAYASAESMILEARESLAAGDLALASIGWKWQALPVGDTPGRVVIQYELLHAPSGETLSFESSTWVVPGKGRPLDKAESGAITENLSYTLRGLLLLPRVDESVSVETREDESGEQASGQRAVAAAADPVVVELLERASKADDDGIQAILSDARLGALTKPDLDCVLAEVACRGFELAETQEELESWVPVLRDWKLEGAAYGRAIDAYAKELERFPPTAKAANA